MSEDYPRCRRCGYSEHFWKHREGGDAVDRHPFVVWDEPTPVQRELIRQYAEGIADVRRENARLIVRLDAITETVSRLADEWWRESQGDTITIHDAGILQRCANELRAATSLAD